MFTFQLLPGRAFINALDARLKNMMSDLEKFSAIRIVVRCSDSGMES